MELSTGGLDRKPEGRERRKISKDTELFFAHLLLNMCRFGEFCLRLTCTLRYHLVNNIAEKERYHHLLPLIARGYQTTLRRV